jgi:hypothetical protein
MRVVTVTDIRYGGIISPVVAAVIFLLGCSRSPVPDPAQKAVTANRQPQTAKLPLPLERVVVPVDTTGMSTLIGFPSNSPLPWKHGNWFTIEFQRPSAQGQTEERVHWNVVNINTENFREITRRLKISSVEVHVLHTTAHPIKTHPPGRPAHTVTLSTGYAVVTDARIPREWFLFEPARTIGHMDSKTARQLKAAFPENFRASE